MTPSPSRPSAPADSEAVRRLADRCGVPFTDLADVRIDRDLVQSFPPEFLYRANVIPLEDDGANLRVAVADPSDLETIDAIRTLSGRNVVVEAATPRAIQEALRKSETALQVLKGATEGFIQQLVEKEGGEEEEVISLEKLADQDGSIIKLVNTIIFTAVQKRASDIHIESKDDNVHVKYRIDGVLGEAMEPIDKKFQAPIISRIKVMSDLDIAERRVPQDGRFRLKIKDKTIDFRVSIMPSIYGEDSVVRILDKEMITEAISELKLDLLGFSDDVLRRFRRYIAQPYGMVLVTGPTGSGKTTTLYAALTEIRSVEDKIVTIEDPVEYQVDGITQIPVNEKKGLTFARGLRSILRHDPDKIMVGEIRDPETAQIAIQSALTGHLVFTTVHANNVFDVIGRFLHMQVDPYSFISALNCILAQRLVRLLCSKCKTPVRYPDEALRESGLDPERYRERVFYEAGGCAECGFTGYHGRTAIAEILDLSDTVREMILIRKPLSEVRKRAKAEGMVSIRDVGVGKVLSGLTSLKELNKVTFVE
ncbi:MAG: type II/IV secretion system protein [Acidobacteria bacterium]|nr:type II/IV secretion system protein [Acidobacteriota bacterium]HOF83614.1 GspE/PulE family protein [Candidatus Aminicenantes bacterium]HOS11458.1 GspE/PulE family protein [Candidatus Aminicenantes bacterium]HOU49483.1 GspE/PulE family protein [Candidatus Aminicenantes bacterium]HPL14353.1 GspE/PulE family protein [Candidatus Aminicenantes bacterium]